MPDVEKQSQAKRLLKNAGISGGVGFVFGYMTGLGAGYLAGDPETGARIGLKTAAGVAGCAFWLTESNHTINNAEGPDRPLTHRLKAAITTIEGGLALGTPGALLSYSYDTPWWAVGMGSFGAVASYMQFRERFRKQPDLVFPEGNSINEVASMQTTTGVIETPKIYLETRLPKVYRSKSLADIVKFREANKEQIVKWAGNLPSSNESFGQPTTIGAESSSPINAVFITQARHFPAADRETGNQMVLYDRQQISDRESINVDPLKESHFFWALHPTNLESGFSDSSYTFDNQKWQGFREASWERWVVILAQYQSTKSLMQELKSLDVPKPEEVVDRYWLIDIIGEGLRVRRRRIVPQGKSVPIPLPNPARI